MEILVLCDYRRDIAQTVADHIDALVSYSRHNVQKVPMLGELPEAVDLDRFDVVVIHYTLVMCMDAYMNPRARQRIAAFEGLKAAFIQDEYRFVDRTKAAMREMGIDALFTCVPEPEIEKVYGDMDMVKTNVLTGYVPENLVRVASRPYSSRPIDIGYRSRDVPEWLGALGQEKSEIGRRLARDAVKLRLRTDISTEETARLYGRQWVKFLTDCKAVLGVESGASVFDFSGEIQKQVDEHKLRDPEVGFEELQRLYFLDKEELIDLRQISPRCFESAATGTLMIMYEGRYSGILEPWTHYVPLKKDHSNMAEVVEALRDDKQAEGIIARAREDVVASGKYSFRSFTRQFDDTLEAAFEPHHGSHKEPYQHVLENELARALRAHNRKMRLLAIGRAVLAKVLPMIQVGVRTVVPKPWRPAVKSALKSVYVWTLGLFGRRSSLNSD